MQGFQRHCIYFWYKHQIIVLIRYIYISPCNCNMLKLGEECKTVKACSKCKAPAKLVIATLSFLNVIIKFFSLSPYVNCNRSKDYGTAKHYQESQSYKRKHNIVMLTQVMLTHLQWRTETRMRQHIFILSSCKADAMRTNDHVKGKPSWIWVQLLLSV